MNTTPKPIDKFASEHNYIFDVVICSASFEDRCRVIAHQVAQIGAKRAFVAVNHTFSTQIEGNVKLIESEFENCQRVIVDSSDPVMTLDNLLKILQIRDVRSAERILIDITTFTHETLLILLRLVDTVFDPSQQVEFVYATAKDYSIGDALDKKWLSKGISEIRSIMGFPGDLVPSRLTHLIILTGFEDYRAIGIINELEPNLVSLGIGDSVQRNADCETVNRINVERIQTTRTNVNKFIFSCSDPFETKSQLKTLLGQYSSYNTIIAPMNTKISTIGAGLLAIEDTSIQLCYAQADSYNYKNYSAPGGEYLSCVLSELCSDMPR